MSVRSLLQEKGVLGHVVLPGEINALLSILDPVGPPTAHGGGIFTGSVDIDVDQNKSPIPGFDFQLALPTDQLGSVPFKLLLEPEQNPTSFKFWLILSEEDRIHAVFRFVERLPGLALTGATLVTDPATGRSSLVSTGKPPILVSRADEAASQLAPSLLVFGSEAQPASIRFTPDTSSTEGIVTAGFEPAAVVFGSSGIGFHCPTFIIDDSGRDKGPGDGAPGLDPPLAHIDADDKAWRGLLARQLDFYLPPDVPVFGGQPIKGYFAIPTGPGGIRLVVETRVPPRPATGQASAVPGFSARIECIDPTATGLSGLTPTLISASVDLPVNNRSLPLEQLGSLTFLAGEPVRATATFARDPVNDPGSMRLALGLSATGPAGLVTVRTDDGAGVLEPAKLFNTAAATATSLIANGDVRDDGGKYHLAAIAAAGAALSSLFEPKSQFVLHGAEIEATGHGLPVGGPISLNLDYSVAVRVTALGVPGGPSVSMVPDQPMRIRVRRVRMTMDMGKSGLGMFDLDYDRAEMEIENPGAWQLDGFEQLFDVIGSRSGRGSAWIEVDLRFKLNLGPVKVSDMTIRGTLRNGRPEVAVTGIGVGIDLPGVVSGQGALHLIEGGFAAHMAAAIVPLQFNADATVIYSKLFADPMVFLALSAELPAPLPLANSGLGLFGVAGMFGIGTKPNFSAEGDPVLRQLQWRHEGPGDFTPEPGTMLFGIGAAIGTLPDLGFTFGAKAEIIVTVPDVSVRGALNGSIMRPRPKMTDPSHPPTPGVSFLGFVGIDKTAVDFAVLGSIDLRPLLEIRLPLVGHYPVSGDTSDWYTYLGADGYDGQGRGIGPVSAKVLPDILGIGANAYLMVRGSGIRDWPVQAPFIDRDQGFLIAFGFSLHEQFGLRPIAWAELHLGLDLLLAPNPLTFAGLGRASGSLHLGPFSLGVSAEAKFLAVAADVYLWVQVTGRIELFFFDVEGTVTITFGGSEPKPFLPEADLHPLDRFEDIRREDGTTERRRIGSTPVLTDDSYRVIGHLAEDPARADEAHSVWPDVLISIPFAFAPNVWNGADGQFRGVNGAGKPHEAKRIGSELLRYWWSLADVALFDVTDEADPRSGGTRVGNKLPARWQVPRGATDATELLLFTTTGDLWVNRRADAGKEIGDPIGGGADICNRRLEAMPSWAIGHKARRLKAGHLLPQSPKGTDPLRSRIEAEMRHYGVKENGQETPLDLAYSVPPPFSLVAARIETFEAPRDLGLDRTFEGSIIAPNLHVPAALEPSLLFELGSFIEQRVYLAVPEAIVDGMLVLAGNHRMFENAERASGVTVVDGQGTKWDRDILDIVDDRAFVLFKQRGRATNRVDITWPVGAQLAVIGLRGMSRVAQDAAATELAAIADLSDQLASAAQDGPKLTMLPLDAHRRTILKPGHLYRLDIDMRWSGERYEAGQTAAAESALDRDLYRGQPGVPGATTPTRRQLFFRTARKRTANPVPIGAAGYTDFVFKHVNTFRPELLERYLAGYEPGQSEQFRFRNDPISAHFTQSHVAALADAYGFSISTAVRRVDRPGPEHEKPTLLLPTWSFGINRDFLPAVDKVRFDALAASLCVQPTPGSTATVDPELAPEAWYEVYVSANVDGASQGRLPGVTFRTSRWRNPQEMLAGLGFTVTAPAPLPAAEGVMAGDLAVDNAAIGGGAVVVDDDHGFQNALADLGLEGWPVAEAPRQSRIWQPDGAGGWLFAGFMLESPEPVHRAGRLHFDGGALRLEGGPPVSFDIRRRDRSGTRLLFLTSTPFPVPASPQRVLLILSSNRGHVSNVVLPSMPGFAEDP